MSKHTEGPWIASDQNHGGNWRLETDAPGYPNDGWIIGTFEGPDAEWNAGRAARACNAHDDLVAALKASQQAIRELRSQGAPTASWDDIEAANLAALARAEATS